MKETNLEKIKIMFVCYGNICRSPMAEFVFKDILKKNNLEDKFYVSSSATSPFEAGMSVHHGTKTKLNSLGISTEGKFSVPFKKSDYEEYDYIIGMDAMNIKNILKIVGEDKENKVYKMMSFANLDKDVADPWYTGDFDKTYDDIFLGCTKLFEKLTNKE